MQTISTVIIDDETSNRKLIAKLITKLNPAFQIAGEANGVKTGLSLISELRPKVVFLDVKMRDGTGFKLLEQLERIDFELVFITGFDSYAIKAFEFNALDYLLKPIDPDRLSKTLAKIVAKISSEEVLDEQRRAILSSYNTENLSVTKIPVHSGNKVHIVSIDDIVFIQAEATCTVFKTQDQKLMSSKQLSDFEFIFEDHSFMIRISKGVYLNMNHIASYSKGNPCMIQMKDGSVFEVSRRRKAEILALLLKKI